MYMETQANLDYWSTDNCCFKVSLRTGTIIIALICMVLQLLTGAAVVMICLKCLDENKTNCTSLSDDNDTSINMAATNQTRTTISNSEGIACSALCVGSVYCLVHGSVQTVLTLYENLRCLSGGMSVVLCQFPFWHQGRLYTAHDNTNDTRKVASLCDTEHLACQPNDKDTNEYTNCIKICQEHESCDTVVCPENMYCTENPSPACECITGFTLQESFCVEDIKYNVTEWKPDASVRVCKDSEGGGSQEMNLLQCYWMPEPEREFFHDFSQRTFYFLTVMLFAYLSAYLILSICTLVGTITCKESLLGGWVFCTWLHMGLIMIDLLITLHLTTALHIITSVAYFTYDLYTWAVVKSHMHAIKVEKNRKPIIEGIITNFSIDGIDISQLATEMTEM